jgi:hypothetical protein
VIRCRNYGDHAGALKAAGLSVAAPSGSIRLFGSRP